MRPLYLEEPVRKIMGAFLRPGADVLTKRAVKIIEADPEWSVLDAGCGPGGSIGLLNEMGFRMTVGLDINRELLNQASADCCRVIQGNLEKLPFLNRSFDLIVCECAWNLTDRELTAKELYRAMKPGGFLHICDIYMRRNVRTTQNGWPLNSCFYNAGSLEEVDELLRISGFSLLRLEDHTKLLKQTAAECVFAHGSMHDFWVSVTGDRALARGVEASAKWCLPGLFLAIGQKPDAMPEKRE